MPCFSFLVGVATVAAFFCLCPINAATITEGPVSVTALIGTNAQFHCVGTGNYLVWEVDGLQADHSSILARGITSNTIPSSGTVQSTLTVPATSVNNGTTVRCAVTSLFSTPAISSNATLTILPGIGRVLNLRFNPAFTQVLWDPPPTAGVLSNLYYQVTLMSNVNSELIINETTDNTYYPLPAVQACQYYTASVTAFSSTYHGDSVVNKQRVIGEYYTVQSMSQEVVVNPDGVSPSVVVLITLNFKLPGAAQACSGQRLIFATHPQSNTSDITTHPDYDIVTTGDILYSITDGIVKKLLYTAVISLVASEGAVDLVKLNFSTFNVQHCDVHTDHTSYILVECTFAINSTAPGFVLIQDEHSQYTINTTLQRHEGDVSKGSVNITDLPAGEYSVTVYDEMEESTMKDKVAYKHSESLQISQIHNPHPTSTLSVSSVHQTESFISSYSSVSTESPSITSTTTPRPPPPLVSVVPVVVGVVSAGFIIVTVVIIVCLLILAKCKHRRNSFAPNDHFYLKPTIEDRYVERKDLKQYLKKPVVDGDLQHPPAAPPPTQPAVYANTQPHFNPPAAPQCTQPVVYAGIKLPPAAPPPTDPVVHANYTQRSTNPPAAPPPTQPVVYGESTNPAAAPPHTQPAVYANTQPHFNPPAAPQCTQPVVYAGIKLPPAAPPPTQPAVYADKRKVYADLDRYDKPRICRIPNHDQPTVYHEIKHTPAAPPPTQPNEEDSFTDGSGQKDQLSSPTSPSSQSSDSSCGSDKPLLSSPVSSPKEYGNGNSLGFSYQNAT